MDFSDRTPTIAALARRVEEQLRASPRIVLQVAMTLVWLPGLAHAFTAAELERLRASDAVSPEVVDAMIDAERVDMLILFSVDTPQVTGAPDAQREERRRSHSRRSGAARSFTSRSAKRALAGRREALLRRFDTRELSIRHRYATLNMIAARLTRPGLLRLLEIPWVARVDLDEGGAGSLVEAVPLAGFAPVQSAGLTGVGARVAIIDSGADLAHPDIVDGVVGEACFCSGGGGCCPGAGAIETGNGSAQDDHGHGTNVTGIVTSPGIVAPVGGAPDAEIVAIKVLDENNSFCCTSDVIKALDHVVDARPDVDIVNLSLATSALYDGDCDEASASTMAMSAAVAALRSRDVLTIAASGNAASGSRMAAPACIADVVSVGAVYDSSQGRESFLVCTDATTEADQVTCFSNSNDRTDLFAPGSATTSAGLGGGTASFRGTSQAAPLVAACGATLLEAHPDATADALELALESSPILVTDTTNGLTFPRLDCARAHESLDALVSAPLAPSLAPRSLLTLVVLIVASASPRIAAKR